MESVHSYETPVNFYQTAWSLIPEELSVRHGYRLFLVMCISSTELFRKTFFHIAYTIRILYFILLYCDILGVTVDGVWIGEWIY
jgi:hypothetical protein